MSQAPHDFTFDWVSPHHHNWVLHLARFANKPNVRALEIGSWEGRSACWFFKHILTAATASLDCVDQWAGFPDQEKRFDHNTAGFGSRIRKHKRHSFRWCVEKSLGSTGEEYDFIYVDGSHEARDVLNDLVLCWPLLRRGGVMICDDYIHGDPSLRLQPQVAIDGFFACHVDWKLLQKGAQFIVEKTEEPGPLWTNGHAENQVKPVKTCVNWCDAPQLYARRPMGNRGVLTSASSPYWLTLKLLLMACGEAGVDVAVADQGLLPWQLEWLLDNGNAVLSVPRENAAQHQSANFDLAWDKPAICLTSPFEQTIWIDSDAVPLRNLEQMFADLEMGPWLSLENFVTELHTRQVYLRLVHRLYGHIPPFYTEASKINTGVFGFIKGDPWLKDWAGRCDKYLADAELKKECTLHDQHALVALLCDPQVVDKPRIHQDRSLNCPANGLGLKESSQRKQYPWESPDCLELLRNDHPQATVVHWLGRPKPFWSDTGKE